MSPIRPPFFSHQPRAFRSRPRIQWQMHASSFQLSTLSPPTPPPLCCCLLQPRVSRSKPRMPWRVRWCRSASIGNSLRQRWWRRYITGGTRTRWQRSQVVAGDLGACLGEGSHLGHGSKMGGKVWLVYLSPGLVLCVWQNIIELKGSVTNGFQPHRLHDCML